MKERILNKNEKNFLLNVERCLVKAGVNSATLKVTFSFDKIFNWTSYHIAYICQENLKIEINEQINSPWIFFCFLFFLIFVFFFAFLRNLNEKCVIKSLMSFSRKEWTWDCSSKWHCCWVSHCRISCPEVFCIKLLNSRFLVWRNHSCS